MRPIKRIIIHHSASPRVTTTIQQIEGWHKKAGYKGVGYHKVIEGGGLVRQGRPDEEIGAHAYGHNHDSLGVCVVGNFENEQPDEAQIDALVQVLATLCKRHGLKASAIFGHRDVNPTACPGKHLFSKLPAIRQRVAAYL